MIAHVLRTDVEIIEQFVAVQTPPIPTPPLRWELWDPSTGPIFEAQVAITQANARFVPEMELHYEPGYGITGQFAGMVLDWTDSAPFTTTHFEFSVGVAEVETWFPELYPPDPIHGPAGVALAFPVVVREFAGGPARSTRTHSCKSTTFGAGWSRDSFPVPARGRSYGMGGIDRGRLRPAGCTSSARKDGAGTRRAS